MKKLTLTDREYEDIVCTLEGALEEMTELSRTLDWYCTQLPEHAAICLEILRRFK